MSIWRKKDSNLEKLAGVISTDNINNYTENEQAIGKWIDGKTIYRKVLSYSDFTPTEEFITKGFKLGTITDIDTIVRYDGMCIKGVYYDVPLVYFQFDFKVNYTSSAITYNGTSYPDITSKYKPVTQPSIWWRIRNTGEIFIRAQDSFSKIILILEYTKQ